MSSESKSASFSTDCQGVLANDTDAHHEFKKLSEVETRACLQTGRIKSLKG